MVGCSHIRRRFNQTGESAGHSRSVFRNPPSKIPRIRRCERERFGTLPRDDSYASRRARHVCWERKPSTELGHGSWNGMSNPKRQVSRISRDQRVIRRRRQAPALRSSATRVRLPRIEHVDKFGTVQDRFDFSDFIEVAPKIYVPTICRLGVGDYTQNYHLTKIDSINGAIPSTGIRFLNPGGHCSPGYSTQIERQSGCGRETHFQLKGLPPPQFRTGAPYPQGFPEELLKELDRDVRCQ